MKPSFLAVIAQRKCLYVRLRDPDRLKLAPWGPQRRNQPKQHHVNTFMAPRRPFQAFSIIKDAIPADQYATWCYRSAYWSLLLSRTSCPLLIFRGGTSLTAGHIPNSSVRINISDQLFVSWARLPSSVRFALAFPADSQPGAIAFFAMSDGILAVSRERQLTVANVS